MTRREFHWLSAAAWRVREEAPRWGDTSRLGRPFAKDPSVIRWNGRYRLYYSMPGGADGMVGWAVGIAESEDRIHWRKLGEILPEHPYEAKGLAAPGALVWRNQVHLFYQTYGNGPRDAICHAVSSDGLRFRKDPANPVFRPQGAWNAGRAIDAEVVRFKNQWWLYAATRDSAMKVQMLVGAAWEGDDDFQKGRWRQVGDGPLLRPELAWEQDCIEAPAVVVRDSRLYMFYAGAYNNKPQQIGCAWSEDGIRWKRLSDQPWLPVGRPGSWNASESGHPGVLVEENGRTYLFFQGNNDQGRTWYISHVEVGWKAEGPYVMAGPA